MSNVSLDQKLSMSLDDIPSSGGGKAERRMSGGRKSRVGGGGGGNRRPTGKSGGGNNGTRVYVGNLDWDVTWQDLKSLCKEVGNVRHADVMMQSDGRSRGFGIVEFASVADAKKAISDLADRELNGRKIFLREDREPAGATRANNNPRSGGNGGSGGYGGGNGGAGAKVYVGNIPFNVSWQDLKDHMRKAGPIARADVPQTAEGRSKGFGLVEFENAKAAQRAINQLDGSDIGGRQITVRLDNQAGNGNNSSSAGGLSTSAKVFVGNLSFDTSWQDLKDHMRKAGSVTHSDVMKRPDGTSKGFGIVEFDSPADARRAIKTLNNSNLDGRQIIVREDSKSDSNSNSRGSGGSGNNNSGSGAGPSGKRVYIGNIPWTLKWTDLKDYLRDEGFDVVHADVPMIPGTTKSRGYALAEFSTVKEAKRAMNHLNEIQMDSRQLFCKIDTR